MVSRALVSLGLATLLSLATSATLAQDPGFAWGDSAEQEIARREKKVDQTHALDASWFHLTSKSYEIYTQVDARFTAELSVFMDIYRDRFTAIFQGESVIARKAEVYVYATQDDFKAKLRSNARGWYRYKFDGKGNFTEHALYTYVDGDAQRSFPAFYHPILLHEGTHQILQELCGTHAIPPWFNEGLASYFQVWDIRLPTDENMAQRPTRLINAPKFWSSWQEGHFPSLDDLLKTDEKTWDPDDFGPVGWGQYSAVESLFICLLSGKDGQSIVKKLYKEVVAGRDPAAILAPKLRKQIEAAWHDYVTTVLKDAR